MYFLVQKKYFSVNFAVTKSFKCIYCRIFCTIFPLSFFFFILLIQYRCLYTSPFLDLICSWGSRQSSTINSIYIEYMYCILYNVYSLDRQICTPLQNFSIPQHCSLFSSWSRTATKNVSCKLYTGKNLCCLLTVK